MSKKNYPEKDFRSAKTGQYVSQDFADHHKATTVAESRKPPRKKRSK